MKDYEEIKRDELEKLAKPIMAMIEDGGDNAVVQITGKDIYVFYEDLRAVRGKKRNNGKNEK